jgi:hypothetical protein
MDFVKKDWPADSREHLRCLQRDYIGLRRGFCSRSADSVRLSLGAKPYSVLENRSPVARPMATSSAKWRPFGDFFIRGKAGYTLSC